MVYTPTPGSAGRVTSVAITPDLTTPLVTAAGTKVTLAEVTGYTLTDAMSGDHPSNLTFESAGNPDGVLYPTAVRGGTGQWTCQLQGNYDIASPYTGGRISNGKFLYFALYLFKPTGGVGLIGYDNLLGRVSNFRLTNAVTAKLATWTCDIEGFGPFPAPGVIVP